MTPTDQTLLTRWCDRADAEAFTELVERHGRMVLGVCRRVLGDAVEADDLAQECFLRLARAEHQPLRDVAGWLHRVATNTAISALRAARKRPATEPDLEPVQGTTLPLQEWRELEPHVDAAIAELPETLRAVVVGHFLEGRSHRELGRHLGLGDRTVGYRIHKGIERLRRTLAARGIRIERQSLAAVLLALPAPEVLPGAWAASLAKVALAGPGLAAAPAAMALGLGAAAGSAKSVLVGAAALVVLLVGGLWFAGGLPSGGVDERSAVTSRGVGADSAANGSRTDDVPERRVVAGQGERGDTLTGGSPADMPMAAEGVRVVGRCVDAEGADAVAGCAVSVRPLVRAEELERAELLGLPEPSRWERSAVSDAEGRFTVECPAGGGSLRVLVVPSDGLSLELSVSGSRADGSGILDLADVRLLEGVRVPPLRVVNSAGRAEAEVRLKLVRMGGPQPVERATGATLSSLVAEVSSDAGGGVRAPEMLPPGRYVFDCAQREIVDGGELELPTEVTEHVVVLQPLGEMERITGVVVDPSGRPIERVIVSRSMQGPDEGFASDALGRFQMLRMARFGADPRRLMATKPGWVSVVGKEPVAWGTEGVELVMQRGREIELRVAEDGSGRPVERFGVRVQPGQGVAQDPRDLGSRLAGEGRHPGGVLRLRLDDGPHRVFVEPLDAGRGLPAPVDLEMGEGVPPVHVVEVPRLRVARFVVTDPAGAPVVGSTLEVCLGSSEGRWVWTRGQGSIGWQSHDREGWTPHPLRILARTTTGADGRAMARIPVDRAARLRLRGEGHMPFDRDDWNLSAEPADPIPVVVSLGGTLVGTIQPPQLVTGYRRLAGYEPTGPADRPAVQLIGEGERFNEPRFPARPVPLVPGEPFRIEHVPPGEWRLRLIGLVGRPGQPGSGRWIESDVAELAPFREGEVRESTFDLAAYVPATLRGRILVNGVPAEFAGVSPSPAVPLVDGPGPIRHGLPVEADGAFTHRQLPGSVRIQVGRLVSEPIELLPGSEQERTFDFAAGALSIRLSEADGTPAAGIPLRIRLRPGERYGDSWSLKTDATGSASFEQVEPGRWRVFHAVDTEVELGSAQATAGLAATLELRVP